MDAMKDGDAENLFAMVTRPATLASRVTDQIERLMTDMRLQPGQRLPSEREMSERFGVSRTVVREAVRSLMARGLLQVRPGSGTTVIRPSAQVMTRSMSHYLRSGQPHADFERLIEVRRLLEVGIAGIAAERRSDADLAGLHAQLIALKKLSEGDDDGYVRCDIGFHMSMARATHNDYFVLLLDSLNEMMIESRRLALKLPRTQARTYRYHKAIYDAIAQQDVEGAREAMRKHLVEAARTAKQALKQ